MEKVTQSFRLEGGTDFVSLPCDQDDGQNVIYWDVILDVFPCAQYIKNGNNIVRKLRDTGPNRILRQRILYHPGVILVVVLSDCATSGPVTLPSIHSMLPPVGPQTRDRLSTHMDYHVQKDPEGDSSDDSDAGKETVYRSRVKRPGYMTDVVLFDDEPQVRSSPDVEAIDWLQKLRNELVRNNNLVSRVKSLTLEKNKLDSRHNKLMTKSMNLQAVAKEIEDQAFNHFAWIQNRFLAIMARNYEPYKNPIPRLFVVLPKDLSDWDAEYLLSDNFRLYFLCECGEHTKPTNSKITHHIHFAKHEGYHIKQPTRFFAQYGEYVLIILKMLKFRISVPGVTISADSILDPKDLSKTLENEIDRVIGVLEKATTKNGKDVEVADRLDEFWDKLKVPGQFPQATSPKRGWRDKTTENPIENIKELESADLCQLESFLKYKDGNNVLGNLFKTITATGHVKWVCKDHFRETFQEKTAKGFHDTFESPGRAFDKIYGLSITSLLKQQAERFCDTVKSLGGTFDENTGRVKVRLPKQKAERFYQALEKAKSVYELSITLDWSTTRSDFKKLRSVLRKSNVRALEIDLGYHDGGQLDHGRYGPIFDIMRHPSIHSVEIVRAPDDFDERLSQLSRKDRFPNLKHIGLHLRSDTLGIKTLLSRSQSLSSLVLNDPGADGMFMIFSNVESLREFFESACPINIYLRRKIDLLSSVGAERTYRALERANSLKELEVHLGWRTAQNDIEKLSAFLTISNVDSLKLRVDLGSNDTSSILGPKRYRSILDIMRHPSTRSVAITGVLANLTKETSALSGNDSFSNLRHMEIELKGLKNRIYSIKKLISKVQDLSSLGFQGDIEDSILIQLYMEIAKHQTCPITFFAKSLCIPPLTTVSNKELLSPYAVHLLDAISVEIDELDLRVGRVEKFGVKRNSEGLMELAMAGDGKQFIQDAAWIVSRFKLGKLVIHMEDGKHEEILESIQWGHIRHLDIKMDNDSAGIRTMKTLVEGRYKWKGPLELEFFQFLALSSKTASGEQAEYLRSFVESTSIKTLSLFVQMTPSDLESMVKTADVSRLEEIELRASGYSEDQVDAVLDCLANAEKLQKVKLWSYGSTQGQIQRMQERGVSLQWSG
ncbi:hypothetical protein B0O80DRAFT_259473 [Mortierella sp. GBAus27b]|nr:hypothetical protein BGX31_009416 [Mortierella sp. GBA43]KAI8358980.1 hypothetical protein B0O80DRAFT_259473 [Mortierella sp. GBAus27b]